MASNITEAIFAVGWFQTLRRGPGRPRENWSESGGLHLTEDGT